VFPGFERLGQVVVWTNPNNAFFRAPSERGISQEPQIFLDWANATSRCHAFVCNEAGYLPVDNVSQT
jgi:hypothetical protein